MSSSEFKPGLEGVVAVETEIMEPDREGGTLRYRGVDVEPLIGEYPYENIWGLLVDDDIQSRMPLPEPFEPVGITGRAPADLQAQTARLSGLWGLGKLNEISDDQAREDLGRISGQMMSIVARSARLADGHEDEVPAKDVEQGRTAAERFLLQWRGHADPKAVKAIDTYWICTAEHGVNASTFTARVVASTGADCGAALSAGGRRPLRPAARWRARVRQADAGGGRAMGDPEKWVRDTLDAGKRIMGFGHRVYRAEDPRSRILKQTARELGSPQIEIAERLEEAALAELERRKPDRPLKTNVEYYSALVLDIAEVPPPLAPAMFACSRVAGWSAHILEQKRTGRLVPSLRALRRAGPAHAAGGLGSRRETARTRGRRGARARCVRLLVPHVDDRRRGGEGADQERLREVLLGPVVGLRSRRRAPERPEVQVGDPGLREQPAREERQRDGFLRGAPGREQSEGGLHGQARVGGAPEAERDRGAPERHVEGRVREPLQARRAPGQHSVRLQAVTSPA